MNSSEYWRLAVQQAAEQMVEDIVDTVNDAIAKALRGQVARVYNPVAAALLGVLRLDEHDDRAWRPLGFHHEVPNEDSSGGERTTWLQELTWTTIVLEVTKEGDRVTVRLAEGPRPVETVVRDAVDQAFEDVFRCVYEAIRHATHYGETTFVTDPVARMILDDKAELYFGPREPSYSEDWTSAAGNKWLQPIGDSGTKVEVIRLEDEIAVRPVFPS
ncbi:MAG: hypothetical protein KatS3mg051_1830 [Anaerolineae bacterium]|nr:MAG: hypothetical protein KatS3mg051_1830 [Anaerolineae bacterium]